MEYNQNLSYAAVVVADFDRTLSKYKHNGHVCATCHNVLEEGGLPGEYKEQAYKIRDKYFPIETDPNLTIEEKTPYMVEWWTKAHALLEKYPLSKEMLHSMVAKSTAKLSDIPLLVFSAGVGDIIREVIAQNSHMYDNMHNEHAVHDSDYFHNLSHRTNLLLMGDSLGDLQMANGAENVEAKLTIGFLNLRVEESLELYKSRYDIVICEDETMDVVNAIVNKILCIG
ncbi:5NT3A-like protein [Mya arenaria]|uniref:5'-nucleotidase n=1 Tax=Mya arenaria TaxID=6604 RepID=A0ABY7EKG1_MYAAR|nr:5NT3A-like protein [Mya arenaria]